MVEALIVMVGSFAFLFGMALFNTYVLACLWEWFLTPIFHIDVPKFALLYGFMLVIGFLMPYRKTGDVEMSDLISHSVAKALVFLLFGWIVHHFFA